VESFALRGNVASLLRTVHLNDGRTKRVRVGGDAFSDELAISPNGTHAALASYASKNDIWSVDAAF
jgi:hypothetical protein